MTVYDCTFCSLLHAAVPALLALPQQKHYVKATGKAGIECPGAHACKTGRRLSGTAEHVMPNQGRVMHFSQGLLVSPKMTEDHYTISLLRSLKAVSERLASQEGKSGKESTQGSTQVAAADKKDNSSGQGLGHKSKNHSGGVKEATLGGVFDLV